MEKNIKKILETLESEGYQAYLVGGYVRDYLLGIASFDVDIATNALPKDIHRIFNSSKSNYGSVNIKIDKLNVDITTYRKDLNYINRRPSTVKYINNLEDAYIYVKHDFNHSSLVNPGFNENWHRTNIKVDKSKEWFIERFGNFIDNSFLFLIYTYK